MKPKTLILRTAGTNCDDETAYAFERAGSTWDKLHVNRLLDAPRLLEGYQMLVKTELLPGPIAGREGQTCTLTNNDGGRFIDRWVKLSPRGSKCIWTSG